MMKFTYAAYRNLLCALKERYTIATYKEYRKHERSAILRHDIDFSLQAAVRLSEIECECGVTSTFFVLLSTDFYNVATLESRKAIQRIVSNGSAIGLDFDEMQYADVIVPILLQEDMDAYRSAIKERVEREAQILSNVIEVPIEVVSMHRPSPLLLEQNMIFTSLINSYGTEYFKECKYLSDSRRYWREPVEEIIANGEYRYLHILTHPFWYHEEELSLYDSVKRFVCAANAERYQSCVANFRGLEEVLTWKEIEGTEGK